MTKTLRKITTWLLGVFMCMALVLGIVVSQPQVETASAAEQTVNFNVAYLEGDTNGKMVLRIDTEGQTWGTYHNDLKLSELPSVANYTTINGRTLTELANAFDADIRVTLQPAGSFSFLRVFVPLEVMTTSQVKAMGILEGWTLPSGSTNYTSPAVNYLRVGDTFVNSKAYTANPMWTSANVSISDAELTHRRTATNAAYANRGADSYIVNIDIGATFTEYDTMYDGYKSIRDYIYINGKTIDDWNAELIAADPRLNEPETYTFFPQNSTDPSHKQWFVKPIGFWGTSTGFSLSIFQEVVAEFETIEVAIGAGCIINGNVIAERISKTVLTQNVVDLTTVLTFLDNSHNSPENWGPTSMYYINTNGQAAWTIAAPKGGCLNECDPDEAGGGQIQLKYIYFNGTSVWDINKNDNGTYGSTQGNIANGGIYAPIFAGLSTELGASLKLIVPTNYTNGKAGHEEIIIKKGFNVKDGNNSYVVTSDIIFTKTASGWTKNVKGNEVETEVTGIITKANRNDGGTNENFVIFQLSENDYDGLNTTAITDISSLYGYIDIDGNVLSARPGEPFFNVWGIADSVAFRAPGLDATQLQQVKYITIKAGAKFPSYTTQNGGKMIYYVTQEDVTFVHNVPNDTWTVGAVPTASHNVTFTVDGATYKTETVENGKTVAAPAVPTKAEDANYTYTFKQWTLNGAAYNFSTPVTGDITLTAEFTATPKNNEVDVTGEFYIANQGDAIIAGRQTYLVKTVNNYWTKSPANLQELTKKLYLNGVSVYDINQSASDTIRTYIGTDNNQYSYIQLNILKTYPNAEAAVNDNHKNIELKSGFSITENGKTYVVTEDIKWVNFSGSWVNVKDLVSPDSISMAQAVTAGETGELLRIDISSSAWNFNRADSYDYNYWSAEGFIAIRKNIFINGVSLFEINTTVDDSNYNYTGVQTNTHTATYNGVTYETFKNPALLYCKGNTVQVFIHKNYLDVLGNGDINVTVGAGFIAYNTPENQSNALAEDKTVTVSAIYEVKAMVDGSVVSMQYAYKNQKATKPSTPSKEMTATTIYDFDNWYNVATGTVFDFNTPITSDVEIEARFTETTVNLIETDVIGIVHHLKTERNDSWMVFSLTNHDYDDAGSTTQIVGKYEELKRIGFLDKIILKGSIVMNNGRMVSEASLMDIYNSYGEQEGPFFNLWGETGTFALRVTVESGVEEIVIQEGCYFPSYRYTSGAVANDTRYLIKRTTTYRFNEEVKAFNKAAGVKVDIQMATGAAVRVTSNMATSGIRFEAKIATEDVEALYTKLSSGAYKAVDLGVLITPTDYLMGGQFTMDWLDKNGYAYLNFTYQLAEIYNDFPKTEGGYSSFFGSIVKLNESNYDRNFSGVAYVKVTEANDNVFYIYANYNPVNSRSASYIANAAINDRQATEDDVYSEYISANNNYSPYTEAENVFLKGYMNSEKVSAINSQNLTQLASKGGTQTITPTTQKLNGPYVELLYSTNVNVWGVFTYTDGSKTANEDFYLQAGTNSHKQYLDIFRVNGVGYGMNTANLSMTKITFTNAELANSTAPAGKVKVIALYSQNKTIDTKNQEIYLTVDQTDGSEITVGAHLGLGGALTYLAKSGIYEGVTASGYRSGNVKISTNTNDFVAERNTNLLGTKKEAGYYGNPTSSKAADGAVNLINNVDAGRQIQQSWYANVGGDSTGAGNGSNGYTRAFCKTESTSGKYWPYNPVQAGDVVSNPSQIVDYEINLERGYIYIKARAMDWAKGQKSSDKLANTIVGGSTTKSYVENYYRLNEDGTLVVNNAYVDWNGFTDMELCDWASTELPAVYPVHTLNYYVSNTDGDGSWEDGLEYNSGLSSWTGENAMRQFTSASKGYTKVEDWFAWANGNTSSAFGMGVYIPNVERLTSGRARTETSLSNSLNRDALTDNVLSDKGLMSNMQPIKLSYKSAYVSNTSYTAPGIDFRMEAYKSIEYSYVICLGSISDIRSTFKNIKDNGTITNAGDGYQKVGLDAWARADKTWTW